MHVREIDLKNIFAFAQAGNFQNLIALQRAIGLHIDHGSGGNPDFRKRTGASPTRAPK